jgi:hypothetical protein
MSDLSAALDASHELSARGTGPDPLVLYSVVASIITVLMLFFVLARLYIRFFIQKKPGWDDLACVIATLAQLSYTGLLIYGKKRPSLV